MPGSEKTSEKPVAPPTKSTVVFLLGTMADTTWRMFVPIIGLTVLGLFADKWLHTTPWIMIVGIIAGVAGAIVLVRRQIKRGAAS